MLITRAMFSEKHTPKSKNPARDRYQRIYSDAKVPRNRENYSAYNFPRWRCNLLQSGIPRKTSKYHPLPAFDRQFSPSTNCNTYKQSWHCQSSLAATPLEWLSNCRKWLLTDVRQYVGRSDYMCSFECVILTQSKGANQINRTHQTTPRPSPDQIGFFSH